MHGLCLVRHILFVGLIVTKVAIKAIFIIGFHLVEDDFALTTAVSEGRIKLEGTIDVAPTAASVLLNVIVVDRAVLLIFVSIILVHEEVRWYPLGLPAQAQLERVLLYIVNLPAEQNLIRGLS